MDEFRPDPSWLHWIPFAALMASETPPNRPMTTRIIEQIFIGIIAGAGGSYLTIQITLAVHANNIAALQQQVHEDRESARQDIKELREQLYRANK